MTVFLHSTDSQRVILHSVVGSEEKDCGCSFTNDEKKKINYDLNFYNYRRLSTVIIELVSEQSKKLKPRINCNKSNGSSVHIDR